MGRVKVQTRLPNSVDVFPRRACVVLILGDHSGPKVVQEDTDGFRGCVLRGAAGAAVLEEGFEEEAGEVGGEVGVWCI